LFLLALVALIGLCFAALSDARSSGGRAQRHVTINGRDVGRLDRRQLDEVLQEVQDDIDSMAIRIATPDGGFNTTGDALGITIDRAQLRRAALDAGRAGDFAERLGAYVSSWYRTRRIPVSVTVPLPQAVAMLQTNEGTSRRDPVDPELKLRDGKYVVLPGSDGEGIDAHRLVAAIQHAVESGEWPPVVSARRVTLPSSFTTDQLSALADRATTLTSRSITFNVNGRPGEITPELLRSWMKPAIVDRQVRLTLDEARTLRGIRALVGTELQPVQDARLAVDDAGKVAPVPSQVGLRCCTPETVRDLQRAFNGLAPQPVSVGLETIKPALSTDDVLKLGVTQPIASFTTRHKPGEDRVINIHRIADLTRGVVIKPGASFSVNDFIGERTGAKGFVQAHSIADGVLVDTFGGGISQYATTLFNAAFFAGLDIPKYKPHSIYISRYPFGREATLSYPQVDLKLRNITPYGVMIWPTYTDTSLTMTLYSTTWARSDVEGGPVKSQRGLCTVVVTTRLRSFPDGTSKRDKFKAEYLPSEGVNCDGSPTAGASTTTNVPRTTSVPRPSTSIGSPSTEPVAATVAAVVTVPEPSPAAPSPAAPSGPVNAGGNTKKPTTSAAPLPAAATTKPEPTPAAPAPTPAASPTPAATPSPAPAPTPVPAEPAPGPVSARPPVTGVG
jgi:vancomycin resistance protein YoaR